ncbi:hypothetical protein LSM04_006703 [Trypanosoma melophagium]|uniref:uncharacterized protein n=1 Tax=Trypanosoma melophagium TaxID=715481 RepID=UPI00351A3817|nr:hypothetical protein LSM04_006703 [Trypanosoma melophagium]
MHLDNSVKASEVVTSTHCAVYEKLLQALVHEREAINNAYNALIKIVSDDPNKIENNTVSINSINSRCKHTALVIHGLAGLVRFMFERLLHHTINSSVSFAQESGAFGNAQCTEAVKALREAIKMRPRVQNKRIRDTPLHDDPTSVEGKEISGHSKKHATPYVFAISSHYDWGAQCDIMGLITRGLNRTAVVLRKCGDISENISALQFGCHVLLSPHPPNALCVLPQLTREHLQEYVQPRVNNNGNWSESQQKQQQERYDTSEESDEIDDELDALLHALDVKARGSPTLTETSISLNSLVNSTDVVPRDVLRGSFPSFVVQTTASDDDSGDSVAWNSLGDENKQLYTHIPKRARLDSFTGSYPHSKAVVTSQQEFRYQQEQEQPSQVIQYQYDLPSHGRASATEEEMGGSDFDPAEWCFQISMSLREKKGEISKAIRRLGSSVDHSSAYNPNTTHLVVAEGVMERTEKYLGCCAALKYIVPPRFVYDSITHGRWLVRRMHEYDRNPLRRLDSHSHNNKSKINSNNPMNELRSTLPPPFCGWRVVLFTSAPFVAAGVIAVLRAGGCEDITSFVFENTTTTTAVVRGDKTHPLTSSPAAPDGNDACVRAASHVLVECREVSPAGRFRLPAWFPAGLPDRLPLFPLELLHHVLCHSHTTPFDHTGALRDERLLPPACRVEPTCG